MKEQKPCFDWKDYNGDIIATNTSMSMATLKRENPAAKYEYEQKRKLKRKKQKEYLEKYLNDSKNNLDN